jgi:general secretion pathway protein H
MRRRGFTLLELVLVMVILCVAMAMVAPSLRGFWGGRAVVNAGDQIAALAQYARTQAICDARVYTLNIDPQQGQYWLTRDDPQGGGAQRLGSEFGRVFSLPQDVTIERLDAAPPEAVWALRFSPNGRADVVPLRLLDPRGNEVQVSCLSAAEAYRVLQPQRSAIP